MHCGGDPSRSGISAACSHVYPGDTLRVEMWSKGNDSGAVISRAGRGAQCRGVNGRAEIA
jgi:hypothetical protein